MSFLVTNNKVKVWVRRLLLEVLLWHISILVSFVSFGKWRTWPRNSLALGYWSENSDLDLTLFGKENTPVCKTLLWLWKVFRPCGEWAVYTTGDKDWAVYANPLELARDPKIIETLGLEPRAATSTEAFIFWLRILGSDEHLRSASERQVRSRARKWNFHLRAVERSTGLQASIAFPAFLEEIKIKLSPVAKEEWEKSRPFLFPHQWLVDAFAQKIAISEYFRDSSPALIALARAQVQWEIWGLLGQVRLRKNYSEVKNHLANLASLFPQEDPIRNLEQKFCQHLEKLENSSHRAQ